MTVLIVLFGAWLLFRILGGLGVERFDSWQESACWALALMFVFTGITHFNRMKHDLAAMVPTVFPKPLLVIYATGVLEILGAIGLLVPGLREFAGIGLIALLLAMFPANVKAAREHLPLRGKPATPLVLRAPMQILFVLLVWWASRLPTI